MICEKWREFKKGCGPVLNIWGKWCMTKGFFSFTCGLQAFFFYMVLVNHTLTEFGQKRHTQSFASLAFHQCVFLFIWTLSVLSLLSVSYSNPGYVGDFFKSKKQPMSQETLSSTEADMTGCYSD